MRFPHLRAALMGSIWAMRDDWLSAMVEIVENRAAGVHLSPDEMARRAVEHSRIEGNLTVGAVRARNGGLELMGANAAGEIVAARSDRAQTPAQPANVIAVIPIMGVIAQHASQVDDISGPGGTSTERVSRSLRAALDDPTVKAIVFNLDSPGGNVHGVQELFSEILAARSRKPIIAQVNSVAASAAYWLACAADEIVVTPGGEVGSIGVYGMHRDVSGAAEQQGLRVTFISAGPHKVEGNPYEAPSEDFLSYQQGQVNIVYDAFVADVARGRGVSAAVVKETFGQGRMKFARDAKASGMTDGIATLDETLRRVAKMRMPANGRSASGEAGEMMGGRSTTRTEALAAEGISTLASGGPDRPSEEDAAETDPQEAAAPLSDTEPSPAGEMEKQSSAERDAFRRRRHAHRMRII